MGYFQWAPQVGAYPKEELKMIGILLTVLVAALVYVLLAALTGSFIVAVIGAILVLIAGIPSGGFGFGSRWGGRRGTV
jgi:CBS-domain-containing membrane protein